MKSRIKQFFDKPIQIKSRDGRVYVRDVRGVIHRVAPIKPWTNKAEHKQYKRARLAERLEATK